MKRDKIEKENFSFDLSKLKASFCSKDNNAFKLTVLIIICLFAICIAYLLKEWLFLLVGIKTLLGMNFSSILSLFKSRSP